MRIFITGYTPRQCARRPTGSVGSLMGAALSLCGHEVSYGPPESFSERYDAVLMGLSSPLAPTARYSLTALSLLGALEQSKFLVVCWIDDPDLRKIGSGHRRAVRSPDDLVSQTLLRSRSPSDRALVDHQDMDPVVYGAYLVASEPCTWTTVLPRHRWLHGFDTAHSLPAGVCDWHSVDLSPVILNPDALIDMGVEARKRGYAAKNRADAWIKKTVTSSRRKSLWVDTVADNTVCPAVAAVDIRDDLVDGFCQALTSLGTLEQPESASVSGWWTPWAALTVSAGGFYATDPVSARHIGSPAFVMLPSYYESLPPAERLSVVEQQRAALREALRGWTVESVCDTVLSAATGGSKQPAGTA